MRIAANAGSWAVAAARITPAGVAGAAVAAWLLPFGISWVADQWQMETSTAPGATQYYWQTTYGGAACRQTNPGESLARCGIKAQYGVTDAQLENCSINSSGPTTQSWGCIHTVSGNRLNQQMGRVNACTPPTVWTPAGCVLPEVTFRPPTEEEWAIPAAQPVPDDVTRKLDDFVPAPQQLPEVSPTRAPVSAPVPVPATNPQEYRQPVVDISPAPTAAEPWRVNVQPGEVTGTDPDGLTEPVPTNPANPPAVPAEMPQLCEAFPDIAACQPLGSVEDVPTIETKVIDLDITPYSGFGPSTSSCPAPRSVQLLGGGGMSLSMPFDLLCDFANGVRPVIIGLAWLAAVMAWLGLSRKD